MATRHLEKKITAKLEKIVPDTDYSILSETRFSALLEDGQESIEVNIAAWAREYGRLNENFYP